MKEVTLYTVVKEKRVVSQNHIDFYQCQYDSVPVYNLGGNTPTKESITVQQIPVEHRVFYRRGNKQEYYIAMTEDVREVFGLEYDMLKKYQIWWEERDNKVKELEKELSCALKTNESLVKYKNALLDEVESLTDRFNIAQENLKKIHNLNFWQRLKFLFTGVLP